MHVLISISWVSKSFKFIQKDLTRLEKITDIEIFGQIRKLEESIHGMRCFLHPTKSTEMKED